MTPTPIYTALVREFAGHEARAIVRTGLERKQAAYSRAASRVGHDLRFVGVAVAMAVAANA